MNLLQNVGLMTVEDDPIQQETIAMVLDELGYDNLGMAESGDEGLALFHRTKPDVVLLDIHLKGEMDGIAVGEYIGKQSQTPLIYLTAFEDQATFQRARLTYPAAYLIKPIHPPSLQHSIEMAIRYADRPKLDQGAPPAWEDDILLSGSIFIKIGQKLMRIRCTEILWVETAGNRYCKLLTSQRTAHVRRTLVEVQTKLNHPAFFRIHRSYLINLQHIEAIHEGEQTVQIGGHHIPIGDTYRASFMDRINRL